MIIKTRASLAERCSRPSRRCTPTATPAILVLPIESVDQGYLDWLMAETDAADR